MGLVIDQALLLVIIRREMSTCPSPQCSGGLDKHNLPHSKQSYSNVAVSNQELTCVFIRILDLQEDLEMEEVRKGKFVFNCW